MLVLPTKSKYVWNKFLDGNKSLIYKYVLREIKKNLESNSNKIDLFTCEDGSWNRWLPKEEIPLFLADAIKVFIKEEEYEYARKADDLIKKYYVYKLLNDI